MSLPAKQSNQSSPRKIMRQFIGALWEVLSRRLRPLWITAGVVLFTFMGFRVALLLARLDGLRGVDSSEVVRCFLLGLRYDVMPLGYFLLPLAIPLAYARPRRFQRRRFRRGVTIYALIVILVVLSVEVFGAAFFLFFGVRLNWIAMYYLQYPREVAIYVCGNYPVWLFIPGLAICIYFGYRVLWRAFWPGRLVRGPRRQWRITSAMIVIAVGIAACRGGMDHRPLGRGAAYISYNNLVNQLTLNNCFTFINAAKLRYSDNRQESRWYPFPPKSEASRVAGGMIVNPDRDRGAWTPRNILWRRTRGDSQIRTDWNVVLILMESMSGKNVGVLGSGSDCTPNLDALCEKGIYFDNMYAVGARTCRGVMGVLSGFPDLGGETVLKRPRGMGDFQTLPSIFQDRGYETLFIYGGDPQFDNMAPFFDEHGIDKFIGQKELGEEHAGNWGVPDEMIFAAANKTFVEMGEKKFFSVILTVSNHEPFVVPQGPDIPREDPLTQEARIRNAYRYADWALGNYFKKASKEDYFKRTIFVLVADHGVRHDRRLILDAPGYRLPCLIYAPGIDKPIAAKKISTVCSQTDIPPTLLSLLGGEFEHCFMGRDILNIKADEGFAFMHEDDRLGIIRGENVLVLPPMCEPILFRITKDKYERIRTRHADQDMVHELQLQMLSYYRLAKDLYLDSAYCRPVDATTSAGN